MKAVKIILSLLVVVVACMLAIYLVEGPTSKIINDRLDAEANEALYEMFDTADEVEKVTDDYPEDDSITEISVMKSNGTQIGVVYKVEGAGYNPGIQFLIGVDSNDNVKGFKLLQNTETAGIGKDLIESAEFAAQFTDVPRTTIQTDGVDLVNGSTAGITLSGINKSVQYALAYHGVNFKGEEAVVPETPEEKVERLKSEFFEGATYTDVTGDYSEPDLVLEILEASTGGFVVTAIFNGYVVDSVYIIGVGTDGLVTGYGTITTNETEGIGADLVLDEEFEQQFIGLDLTTLIDTGVDLVGGSTAVMTLAGVNESLNMIADFIKKDLLNVQDTLAPVIEVLPKQTEFEAGSDAPLWDTFVSVSDNEEVASVENDASEVVDMDTAGTYTVTYTATDTSGNIATETIDFTIVEGAVEIILIPVPGDIETVLLALDPSADAYSDELISDDVITGVYTSRDVDKNITSVFYSILSGNGSWASDNLVMVQFDPTTNTIVKVNVYVNNASYYTSEYAPNEGVGENLDSEVIADEWIGVGAVGSLTETDLDTVAGTTAEESFPALIEAIDYAIQYQLDNNIGGAN